MIVVDTSVLVLLMLVSHLAERMIVIIAIDDMESFGRRLLTPTAHRALLRVELGGFIHTQIIVSLDGVGLGLSIV